MVVQILDAKPHGLTRSCAGDSQDVDQQTQLMITSVGRCDEVSDLCVGDDDVARLLRIRQTGQPDFPSLPVLNPLVMMSRQLQGGEQASANAIDRGGGDLAEQAVAPLLQ